MSVDNQQPAQSWPGYPKPGTTSGPGTTSDPGLLHHPEAPATAPRRTMGGHGWMMLLMCVPLVAIGLWQLATGAGFQGLIGGLMCFGMMAAMHVLVGRNHKH